MRKMREDSTWNQINPEQRETVEEWLFEENLGFAKTVERVKEIFGLETTISSVGRFYRRRAQERQADELLDAQIAANELNDLPVSAISLRQAAVKLVGKAVLKLATEKPEELEQLVAYTKLLLQSDDNDIRRARLRLAERYFDYEAVAACQKELPNLRAYLKVVGDDDSQTNEEKLERVHKLLYGRDGSKPN